MKNPLLDLIKEVRFGPFLVMFASCGVLLGTIFAVLAEWFGIPTNSPWRHFLAGLGFFIIFCVATVPGLLVRRGHLRWLAKKK